MAGPYGQYSESYFDRDVRPFPVEGKRPCIANYNLSRFGSKVREKLATKFPDANLGLLTARSRLAVIDVDDRGLIDSIIAIAGPTPLRVQTRRGEHLYYRDSRSRFVGISQPGGQAYDIKGSGSSDFVLIPGSTNAGVTYGIVGYEGTDIAGEFSRLLQEIPSLTDDAYRRLAPRSCTPNVERWKRKDEGSTYILQGAQIPVGQRNQTLFRAACRDAHEIQRSYGGVEAGRAALASRCASYNDALCELPLPDHEIGRLASSAWKLTLSGINRPPRRSNIYVGERLKRMGKNVRALALWGWLTQEIPDISDFELAPVRLASLMLGWKRHDAEEAIRGLTKVGVLAVVEKGGRGRGRVTRYRLTEGFVSDLSFSKVLARVNGDAAAVALLAFVVDAHGPSGRAELSAGGMASMVNGPFGRWTKVGIRKAYDLLVKTGLLNRVHRDRSGVRAPRALFQICASGVLKMPGIVPVELHAPLSPSVIPTAARSAPNVVELGRSTDAIDPPTWVNTPKRSLASARNPL
ncbi:MAG: bifunctional DNA primase/polymerase [Brevundimonas sp.]|uniref:bifunctional DNA primase/polymerase n=1 Tax=Brevundimonas sp. TaxID=1871086 RepID=UPI002ABBA20B|nr:bifunctional DNA primase/polymerase [Brevundimonas sp.]MDZ4110423.1 bifunctional DNA primase/polymerase [Brevundimonas sp.]